MSGGINTVLPRVQTQFIRNNYNPQTAMAGTIAVVGYSERAGEIEIITPNDDIETVVGAGKVANHIKELFKQVTMPDGSTNYGADTALYFDVAQREASTLILNDGSATPSPIIDVELRRGGSWGDEVKMIISTGLNPGFYDYALVKDGITLEKRTNLSPRALFNELNNSSKFVKLTANGTTNINSITALETGTFAFSGGSEKVDIDGTLTDVATDGANITFQNVAQKLQEIKYDQFDAIIFALPSHLDTNMEANYDYIQTYIDERHLIGKFTSHYLPLGIAKDSTLFDAVQMKEQLDSHAFEFVHDYFKTESADDVWLALARYAGFVAGIPVYESAGNKVIPDAIGLSKELTQDEQQFALQNGITVFTRTNLRDNNYKVRSAVTASQEYNTDGSDGIAREQHAKRSLYFALNYIDLNDLLCATGAEEAKNDITAYINQKKQELINNGVIEDLVFSVNFDPEENRHVFVDYTFYLNGIVKVITNRVRYGLAGGS